MPATPGRLIIEFVPDEEAKKALITFLTRITKGTSEGQISQWISNLPAVVNVVNMDASSEKAAIITSYLAGFGVKARFVASVPAPEGRIDGPGSSPPESSKAMPNEQGIETRQFSPTTFTPASAPQSRRNPPPKRRIRPATLALVAVLCAAVGFFAVSRYHYGGLPSAVSSPAKTATKAPSSVPKESPRRSEAVQSPDGFIEINGVKYAIIDDYAKWVPVLYVKKDFKALEEHVSSLLREKDDPARMNELNSLYAALGRIANDGDIEKMKSVLEEWCTQSPYSHIPWLVRGMFHIEYGWRIRGSGVAKDVSKEAWPVFNQAILDGRSDLERSWRLNRDDPNSSCFLLIAARAMSYPRDKMEEHFQNAVSVCPVHYGARRQKLEYLMPKWGGSQKEMFDFAFENYKNSEQNPFLGLLLVEAYSEVHARTKDENVLGKDEVWRDVQKIFQGFFGRYPQDVKRRFSYAYHAYRANKWDIAYDQFEIIGDRWITDSHWRSLEEYNRCRAVTYYKKGEKSLVQDKDYASALDYFQTSIRYNPAPDGYYGVAMSYWYSGYPKKDMPSLRKAESFMSKAVELNPGYEQWDAMLKKMRECLKTYGN